MTETPTPLRWIDNHCHLDDDANSALVAARAAGVQKVIDVGCDLATSRACLARAAAHEGVYATVGLHPHEARHGLDGLESLLSSPDAIAVGECGLDFHYDHSPREQQRAMFAAQIELAHRHHLPVVVHTREAWEETFEILDTEGVPARTIFHCFSGGPSEAEACIARGGWLSFSGIVSFRSATDVRAAATQCPPRSPARRDRRSLPGAGPAPRKDEPTRLGQRRGPDGCRPSPRVRHRHRGCHLGQHPSGLSGSESPVNR